MAALRRLGRKRLNCARRLTPCSSLGRKRAERLVMAFPPLIGVDDLGAFVYFQNFPHLALCAVPLAPQSIDDVRVEARPLRTIDHGHLCAAQYVLPSAACYNVYLH